jgi:hypothetical protein
VSAVATRRWCRMYGCGEEPVDGSQFCASHRHAAGETGRALLDRMDAGEPVGGLEEAAAVGQTAVSGSAASIGEPERAAVSSSPRERKWTREKVVAAIREVGEKVGHTPSHAEMIAAGYGSGRTHDVLYRLGATWAELVQEAGFEPNTKSTGSRRRAAARSEREPEAQAPAAAEPQPRQQATAEASRSEIAVPDERRDPIRTADVPYDADILEDEARFLRMRANALEQIAGGIRQLAALSARPEEPAA